MSNDNDRPIPTGYRKADRVGDDLNPCALYLSRRSDAWIARTEVTDFSNSDTYIVPADPPSPWVSVTERKPTKDDADAGGNVFQHLVNGTYGAYSWHSLSSLVEWMPIPPLPTEPQPSATERQVGDMMEKFDTFTGTFREKVEAWLKGELK